MTGAEIAGGTACKRASDAAAVGFVPALSRPLPLPLPLLLLAPTDVPFPSFDDVAAVVVVVVNGGGGGSSVADVVGLNPVDDGEMGVGDGDETDDEKDSDDRRSVVDTEGDAAVLGVGVGATHGR